MVSNKDVIKIVPTRIRDKLSKGSKLKFYRNRFGFYTNGYLVLKDIHSRDILDIELINSKNMKDLLSIDTNKNSVKYKFSWFNYTPSEHLIKVRYLNNDIKYFYTINFENNIVWDEFESITHIVYLDENLGFTKVFSDILDLKYNSKKSKKLLFKSFNDALKAIPYILDNDDINIVILTEESMKNLSAKNLIKRIRKTRKDILFMFFSNEKYIDLGNIDDVEFFDKSDSSKLFEKLDSIIK